MLVKSPYCQSPYCRQSLMYPLTFYSAYPFAIFFPEKKYYSASLVISIVMINLDLSSENRGTEKAYFSPYLLIFLKFRHFLFHRKVKVSLFCFNIKFLLFFFFKKVFLGRVKFFVISRNFGNVCLCCCHLKSLIILCNDHQK